jgi:predicted metal-dependent hydrolase
MSETIQIGDVSILVSRKSVKNVHLSVYPPSGRVTLVAPDTTRLEVARAYAISKLGWIREQQSKLRNQAREAPRQFVERESHYVWGLPFEYCLAGNEACSTIGASLSRYGPAVMPKNAPK